jgi:hypothetical protein
VIAEKGDGEGERAGRVRTIASARAASAESKKVQAEERVGC